MRLWLVLACIGSVAEAAPDHRLVARDGRACARRADGALACWGRALGGSRSDVHPTVVAGFAGLTGVAANEFETCGWRAGGAATCAMPGGAAKQVAGLDAVDEMSAAGEMTCARHHGGRVACWRRETRANGEWLDARPRQVPGLDDAIELAVAGDSACARRANGEVACWKAATLVPASVPAARGATAIAGGNDRVAALLPGGKVVGWDDTGTAWNLGAPEGLVALANGARELCGVTAGGVTCTTHRDSAADPHAWNAVPDLTGVAELSVGRDGGCAIVTGGGVRCWGTIPRASIDGIQAEPLDVAGLDDAVQLAGNVETTCAVRASSRVTCWGQRTMPFDVRVDRVIDLAMEGGAACARRADGTTWCWGNIGDDRYEVPTKMPPPFATTGHRTAWTDDAPRFHCERRPDGLACDTHGPGTRDEDLARITDAIDMILPTFGGGHLYVLRNNGTVMIRTMDNPELVAHPKLRDITAISIAHLEVCALHRTGGITCLTPGLTSRELAISDATQLAGSLRAGCALRRSGRVACWGDSEAIGTPPPHIVAIPDLPL